MAALNISHELLQASEQSDIPGAGDGVPNEAMEGLARKIDKAIFSLRQMEIG